MGREKLLNSCAEIFDQFENPNSSGPDECGFIDFLSWFTDSKTEFLEKILNESELKLEDEAATDVLYALWETLVILAFGMGFALGSFGQFIDPDMKKNVEEVRTAIMQNKLLDHLNPSKASMARA